MIKKVKIKMQDLIGPGNKETNLTLRVTKQIMGVLDECAIQTGLSKSYIVRKALVDYLEAHNFIQIEK